jgi:hypothetical protein
MMERPHLSKVSRSVMATEPRLGFGLVVLHGGERRLELGDVGLELGELAEDLLVLVDSIDLGILRLDQSLQLVDVRGELH